MAEITAAMVKALRESSGLPMMDCKNALAESGGDAAAALELLRKRGAAAAEKKAGRETAEGRIGCCVDKDRGVGALAEVLCETAPTSNNPEFQKLVADVAKHAALAGSADAQTIRDEKFVDDPSKTVKDLVTDVLNRIRENMTISRVVRMEGRLAAYVHHNGRVGVLLAVEGGGGDDVVLNDVCMHVAAMQPEAAVREQMPADVVAREREFQKEQIIASGKPADLAEKILVGKMNRWYSERVLVDQPFVMDDKKTVGKVLGDAGLKVVGFVRWQVGGA